MKLMLKILCAILVLSSLLIFASSCSPKYEVSDVYSLFDKMYKHYNKGEFDKYLSYYDIPQNQKDAMLNGLNETKKLFEQTCKLEEASLNEQDIVGDELVAKVTVTVTSRNLETNDEHVMKEVTAYRLSKAGGSYRIINFSAPEVEMISINGEPVNVEEIISEALSTEPEANG